MRRVFGIGLVAVLCLALGGSAASATIATRTVKVDTDLIDLQVASRAITKATVFANSSSRGAAVGVLRDGRLILGGGKAGGRIFLYTPATRKMQPVGSMINKRNRLNDTRFAITDIAVLAETPTSASLLVSFPHYNPDRECVSVVVMSATLDKSAEKVKRTGRWFTSQPCVPVSAVQHASGRIAPINSTSAYLTVGDLGYTKINNRTMRGQLGSVFKITADQVTRISQGHRNMQGILIDRRGQLLVSEHGPRGGDELNLIKPGKDYGWPFVTYGEPYSDGDYVMPGATGTHAGYEKPLYYWVPSVAPTELEQVPDTKQWGPWANQLVMGTLREESLIRIDLSAINRVLQTEEIALGERIRDMAFTPDGSLVATTDSGLLLTIKPASN